MSNLILLATIAGIHALALISPGPDFIMAVRNSLRYSRKTGIYTAVGFGMGIMVHITYCMAGLALVISKSILLFNVMKYLGAAYLMYIGIKSILAKSGKINIAETAKEKDIHPLQAVKMGFLTNVLNPKATLFFLSLFTFIIKPGTPPEILAAASIIMVGLTVAWFSLVAIFFTHNRIRATYEKFQKAVNRTLGAMLLMLGIHIALSKD